MKEAIIQYNEDPNNNDNHMVISWKPIVRCQDCKHRPKEPNWKTYESGFDLEFPEGSKCPCRCSGDEWYSWYPEDDWFCANSEHK